MLMANLTPLMFNGTAGRDPVQLNCTASVGFSINSTEYEFVWWRNEQMINSSDGRIMVCMVPLCAV